MRMEHRRVTPRASVSFTYAVGFLERRGSGGWLEKDKQGVPTSAREIMREREDIVLGRRLDLINYVNDRHTGNPSEEAHRARPSCGVPH
jgi:hypothetical protein